ncbi:hypothetical protein D3C80_877460 [compost metagenome]
MPLTGFSGNGSPASSTTSSTDSFLLNKRLTQTPPRRISSINKIKKKNNFEAAVRKNPTKITDRTINGMLYLADIKTPNNNRAEYDHHKMANIFVLGNLIFVARRAKKI